MSQQLINLNPDLKRLRDEGFDLEIRAGHLLIKDVPYVNSNKEVKLGVLVSELSIDGDKTTVPHTHVAHFIGDYPCNHDGTPISAIHNQSRDENRGEDLIINHSFSSKPPEGYKDHYEKVRTYIAIISNQAEAIDPNVTAQTFPVIVPDEQESVFQYFDTASSRAGIMAITEKLKTMKIGIVGVGGTGSYVLDFVAKTSVEEIHIFDGDTFSNHNAFRSPGAASIEELNERPKKVSYLKDEYSKMHRKIVAHECFIESSNLDLFHDLDFVFICMDNGTAKKLVVDVLEEKGISFIDVGMGLYIVNDSLAGVLRVTSSTPKKRDHVRDRQRISFSDDDADNEYAQNIQIAELNALNAALAVIKWKKIVGFYNDLEDEHFSTYTIDGNFLTNEEMP